MSTLRKERYPPGRVGFSSEAICLAKPPWPSCQVCLFGISIRTKWARARTWSPENLVLAWQRRCRRWRRRRVLLDSLITLCRLRRHMHRLLFKGREGALKYYRVVDILSRGHTCYNDVSFRSPLIKEGKEERSFLNIRIIYYTYDDSHRQIYQIQIFCVNVLCQIISCQYSSIMF